MSIDYIPGPNRYLCVALEEMRQQMKNLNRLSIYRFKKVMPTLIEEVQTMANRMEAGLSDWNDLERIQRKLSEAKKEVKKSEENEE